ncbi:MAG: DNA gyrase inhibitor YacG [Rubrivivax sp.]
MKKTTRSAGDSLPGAPRRVPCPSCRQPASFDPSNPWRPFCSERCRGADLGAWASEGYRVPATPPADLGDEPTPPSENA